SGPALRGACFRTPRSRNASASCAGSTAARDCRLRRERVDVRFPGDEVVVEGLAVAENLAGPLVLQALHGLTEGELQLRGRVARVLFHGAEVVDRRPAVDVLDHAQRRPVAVLP